MASAALAVVRGDARPVVVTLAMAVAAVGYWERLFDDAVEGLCNTGPGTTAERLARGYLCTVSLRLDAACARRDRIQAERLGRRWLRLVAGTQAVPRG